MPPADEPLLEGELAGRSLEPGAQPVVGGGKERGLEPERGREPSGDTRERFAAAQPLGADQMQPEIAVAEPKSGLGAELVRGADRLPRLVLAPPAALLVEPAGERVEDRVQIGRDVKPKHLDVVTDVADDRQLLGIDRLRECTREAGVSEPASRMTTFAA
jgi:hypothetical protein